MTVCLFDATRDCVKDRIKQNLPVTINPLFNNQNKNKLNCPDRYILLKRLYLNRRMLNDMCYPLYMG